MIRSLWRGMAALALVSAPAHAASFHFDGEAIRGNSGRAWTPSIKISLNAMTGERGVEQRLDTDVYGRPVITAENLLSTYYTLVVSVKDDVTNETFRVLPPGPCRAVECQSRDYVNLVAIAPDGTPVLFKVTIASPDGSLDPASIYAFNPQPEPPGDFDSPLRVDFRLRSLATSSVASATVSMSFANRELVLD